MTTDLLKAIEGISIGRAENSDRESCIDEMLMDQRPRKPKSKTTDDLKQQLEVSFLTPPTSFNSEWLDRLQQ